MSTELAARMQQLEGSATGAVLSKVTKLRQAGMDIISLNVGEPDFPTPDNIKEAGIRAIREDCTRYTPGAGMPELRVAVAEKLRRENNIPCMADNIIITVGAKQAITAAVLAIAGPGDEVIIPVPYYVSYAEVTRLAGAEPVFVDLNQETYALDLDAIRAAVTPRTKAIIICTPNNPTGTVYSEEQLRGLAKIALEHDFFMLVDEIYEKIVFDDNKHFSVASISEEVMDHTITVNGFSKTYSMTGWRIGYAAARKDVAAAILKITSQDTTCDSSISQKAAIEALAGPQDAVDIMVREFAKRRDFLVERLKSIPGIVCPDVQGAFYLFLDVRYYFGKQYGKWIIKNDHDLCDYLIEEGGVAMMHSAAYGSEGRVRISYATSRQNLEMAMDRMEAALARLV